jgi:hypothetical protein
VAPAQKRAAPPSMVLYPDDRPLRLLLEPYLGYTTGAWKYNWGDSSFDGYSYGARLGLDYLAYEVGVEYQLQH